MQHAAQKVPTTIPYPRSVCIVGFILAFSTLLTAGEPPPDLARRVAFKETESQEARSNYAYRQVVKVEEIDEKGMKRGEYQETRDVIFSPDGERTEQVIGKPRKKLDRLVLSEEDFRDMREVQPFLFTKDQLWLYETRYKGEETIGGIRCYVLEVKPRQLLQGQRLFEGLFWVDQADFSIVQSEGRAVPQIIKADSENLFPRFTTIRKKIGDYWFPEFTLADDTLPFSSGPIRMRMEISYSDYKRFGTESEIRFGEPIEP